MLAALEGWAGGGRLARSRLGVPVGEHRLGVPPVVVGRAPLLLLPGDLSRRGGLLALLAEGVGLQVAVLAQLRRLAVHHLPQLLRPVRVVAGEGRQALPLLVRLVLVLTAVTAQQELAHHQARRRRPLDAVGAVIRPDPRVVRDVGVRRARPVLLLEDHAGHQEVAQHVDQRRLALHPLEVLEGDVADLVAEHGGQHVVVEAEVEQAAGDEDLAPRQGEGVRHRHVDQGEGERELLVVRLLRELVADAVDARQLGGVVVEAVLDDDLLRRLQALGEELGVGDRLRRRLAHRQGGEQHEGDLAGSVPHEGLTTWKRPWGDGHPQPITRRRAAKTPASAHPLALRASEPTAAGSSGGGAGLSPWTSAAGCRIPPETTMRIPSSTEIAHSTISRGGTRSR